MSATTTPAPARPTMAQIITTYGLQNSEAEVVRCILIGSEKLQNYWRARAALERLIKQEEQAYKA